MSHFVRNDNYKLQTLNLLQTSLQGAALNAIKARLLNAVSSDAAIQNIATTALAMLQNRIHVQGLAVDGSEIGKYDTVHPLYVNPDKSPVQFTVGGKKSEKSKVKENTKNISHLSPFTSPPAPPKTRYFNSYADYRQTIGLPVDKVNLVLSGELQNQLTVIKTATGYGLGWSDPKYQLIARGLEQKYGNKIWGLSEEERAAIYDDLTI